MAGIISEARATEAENGMLPLCVATLNVGRGFDRKISSVLAWCRQSAFHLVALQEVGRPSLQELAGTRDYFVIVNAGDGGPGVAMVVHEGLSGHVRKRMLSPCGRLLGVVLELGAMSVLFVCVYLPSGLDGVEHSDIDSEFHERDLPTASSARRQAGRSSMLREGGLRRSGSDAVSAGRTRGVAHNSRLGQVAEALYDQILHWSADYERCVILGDMNETLSRLDRSWLVDGREQWRGPLQASDDMCLSHAARPRFMSRLLFNGFVDAYRACHMVPNFGDFTCSTTTSKGNDTDGGHCVCRSRIDYALVKGLACTECDVLSLVPVTTSHRPLSLRVMVPRIPLRSTRFNHFIPPTPNVAFLSDGQRRAICSNMEREVNSNSSRLHQSLAGSPDDLDILVLWLCDAAYTSAVRVVGCRGAPAFRSWRARKLRRLNELLSRARISMWRAVVGNRDSRQSASLVDMLSDRTWRSVIRRINRLLPETLSPLSNLSHIVFMHDCTLLMHEVHAWMSRVAQLQCEVRRQRRAESVRMKKSFVPAFGLKFSQTDDGKGDNATQHAHIRRAMRSSGKGEIVSVVDPCTHRLVNEPNEVKRTLRDYFSKVFDIPSAPPPSPLLASLAGLQYGSCHAPTYGSIDAGWYDGLMDPMSREELLTVVNGMTMTAPGLDGVSGGLWRMFIENCEGVRDIVLQCLNMCLRLGCLPSGGKVSIIIPVPKKPLNEMTVDNIRPISLQSSLTKLLMKGLATRLSNVFARHPILHPAQEGFRLGGSVYRSIDAVLDTWELSRAGHLPCYNLFYDIRQAYDSVRREDLLRACRRLCMPDRFVRLIGDSLTGLCSVVRTIYGYTDVFPVRRSVRQGDPLAAILYTIFVDEWHCGLHIHPITKERYGFRMHMIHDGEPILLAGRGYADDTWGVSASLDGLVRMHEWSVAWCEVNHLQLHYVKTVLVGRDAHGCDMQADERIAIGGKVLIPLPANKSVRHLGVLINMNLDWRDQCADMSLSVGYYSHFAIQHRFSPRLAAFFFNHYMVPKLEFRLKYVQVRRELVEAWDRVITGTMGTLLRCARRLNVHACSLLFNIMLPSVQEKVAKLSEWFIRLNSTGIDAAIARSRWVEVVSTFEQLKEVWDGDRLICTTVPNVDMSPIVTESQRTLVASTNRLYAVWNVLQELKWSSWIVNKAPQQRDVLNIPLPVSIEGVCTYPFSVHGSPVVMGHFDMDRVPGAVSLGPVWHGVSMILDDKPRNVMMCTDGSVEVSRQKFNERCRGAWALCIVGDWLHEKGSIIPRERDLTWYYVRGAPVFGSRVPTSMRFSCAYTAELLAIAHALVAVPLAWNVAIQTDSDSAIAAVYSFEKTVSERRRIRSACRPILAFICRMLATKRLEHASVSFCHVRAHSDLSSPEAIGNSIADFMAKRALSGGACVGKDRFVFDVCDVSLPWALEESFVAVYDAERRLIVDDIRASVVRECQELGVARWKTRSSQCRMADVGTIEAFREIVEDWNSCIGGTGLGQVQRSSFCRVRGLDLSLLVRCCTDSVQYRWAARRSPASGPGSSIIRTFATFHCRACGGVADLVHLLHCSHVSMRRFRTGVAHGLVAGLDSWPRARVPLRNLESRSSDSMGCLCLRLLMHNLFRIPGRGLASDCSAIQGEARLTRVMCGIISQRDMLDVQAAVVRAPQRGGKGFWSDWKVWKFRWLRVMRVWLWGYVRVLVSLGSLLASRETGNSGPLSGPAAAAACQVDAILAEFKIDAILDDYRQQLRTCRDAARLAPSGIG